jgi:hypothetical protein
MIPANLEEDVGLVRQALPKLDVEVAEEGGMWCVLLTPYAYGPHFTLAEGPLLLRVTPAYRLAKPDMFWTEEGLLLQGGRVPQNADQVEPYLGKRWRRFSWHPAAWNPASDNLLSFLAFVDRRFSMNN